MASDQDQAAVCCNCRLCSTFSYSLNRGQNFRLFLLLRRESYNVPVPCLALTLGGVELWHLVYEFPLRSSLGGFHCHSGRQRQGLLKFLSPTNAPLYYIYEMLKCTVKISHDCSYMFRSTWTIIREPMLSLAKVTILWRQSVKIRRYMFSSVVVKSVSSCGVYCVPHGSVLSIIPILFCDISNN